MTKQARPKSQVVAGPFWTRRKARALQRKAQAVIDAGGYASNQGWIVDGHAIPFWARGVRVERMGDRHFAKAVGRVTWCLVATSERGH